MKLWSYCSLSRLTAQIHSAQPAKCFFVTRFLAVAFVGCLSILAACSSRPKEVDLIFINGSEPQTLDPSIITGQLEGRICNALFEGLTARNSKGQIVPGMAKSWETNEAQTQYTFQIRNDATWSNGEPVTAHDFVNSWERALSPALAAEYAYIMYFIRGAEDYNKGKHQDFSKVGVRAVGDHTLIVDLNAPTPFFPSLTSFVTYFPVHVPTVRKHGIGWVKPQNIVTNGAYRLQDWKIHDRVELKKNPTYWRADSVRLNRIDALAVSNAGAAFNLYATGQADLILDKGMVPQMLLAELIGRPDFHSYTYLGTYFYRFNTTRKPFDNPLVRKALSAAIDRERITRKITKAGEQIATAFSPHGMPGYTPPSGIDHDPEQAKAWLAEAGFPNGEGFPRFHILYNKSDLHEKIALEIQDMWKTTLGIQCELKNQQWATYLQTLANLEYDVARSSWIGDYVDPNTFLDCFITGGGNNRTGWSNDQYDAYINQANRTSDPEARMKIFQQAEKLLVHSEPPIAPLYYYAGILFYNADRLKGIEPNVLAEHPLREMYLAEE
ncbi:MAG: peptide ABC transporter substrate-binding protein [Verrucomicrobiota bacterium]